MVDAGAVGDDEGGAVIGFRFVHGLEQLHGVGAHGDLGDVDVAVAHGHNAQILFLRALAGGGELGDRAGGRSLGGLAAGIGVHLGIKHQDVDVLVLGQHVIQAAEADIIGPAVAAEDPDGLLDEDVLVLQHFARSRARVTIALLAVLDPVGFPLGAGHVKTFLARGNQLLGGGFGQVRVLGVLEPFLAGQLQFRRGILDTDQFFNGLGQLGAALVDGQVHAEAELGVVFKQAVCPGGAVTFIVHCIGYRGGGTAVDGAAAGGVGDDHPVAEQLGRKLHVGGLAAAGAGAGELKQGL